MKMLMVRVDIWAMAVAAELVFVVVVCDAWQRLAKDSDWARDTIDCWWMPVFWLVRHFFVLVDPIVTD